MKTYIVSGILIILSAVLCYFKIISIDIAFAVVCYMIIQMPKRDTQRKIEDASRNPAITVKPDTSARRFAK